MEKREYKNLVKKYEINNSKLKNFYLAFISGGFIGMFAEIFVILLKIIFNISRDISSMYLTILLIFIATFLTAVGIFDRLVLKFKCGLLIPTTGFAHSVQSSAIDYKKDGLVTGIGANIFKLAGSVIIYGIISSFFLIILKVILNG